MKPRDQMGAVRKVNPKVIQRTNQTVFDPLVDVHSAPNLVY